jgi:hypothetical protein
MEVTKMVDMYEEPTTPANCNYEVIENYLSFTQALDKLIKKEDDTTDNNEYGIRICTWNKAIVIRIQKPDENSKMTGRYLYKNVHYKNYKENNIPWVPNNEYIFNNFWELVKFVKNEDVIPDKETINKMTASMYDDKKYEAWFKNTDIQKEFDNCRRKCEELKKDYAKYCNLVTKDKTEDNDKCASHCAKKCLNECHKADTKPNNNQTIIVKGDVRKLVDTFDEIIDALLS